jgi:hypothetical protein
VLHADPPQPPPPPTSRTCDSRSAPITRASSKASSRPIDGAAAHTGQPHLSTALLPMPFAALLLARGTPPPQRGCRTGHFIPHLPASTRTSHIPLLQHLDQWALLLLVLGPGPQPHLSARPSTCPLCEHSCRYSKSCIMTPVALHSLNHLTLLGLHKLPRQPVKPSHSSGCAQAAG